MSPTYRLTKSSPSDPPRRHLIDQYKHRAQTVTCTCGWSGSTFAERGEASEWALHVRDKRGQTF